MDGAVRSVVRTSLAVVVFTAGLVASARADVITTWNDQVFATGGPQIQRTLAMVHVAMFDALNAIEPRYQPYLKVPLAPAGVSPEAAAAGAAYGVLIRLFPAQQQALDSALTASLAAVPQGTARTDGLKYGDLVAQFIYGRRLDDQMLNPAPAYVSGSGPGAYQTGGAVPVNSNAATWTPFGLQSASQFRPKGPAALGSAQYARDFEETRLRGGTVSGSRTLDQEEIARFHTEQGQFQFNRIARNEAANDGEGLLRHARLFALLNLALCDAITAVFEAKYFYNSWRPFTAIPQGDSDGNPATASDPTWTPFLPTPPHPEYPAAHGAGQAAAAVIMNAYFGQSHAFRTTSPTVPGAVRSYASINAFISEGREARILGGMHFRSSLEDGTQQGVEVGRWVLDHYLQPLE